MRRNYAAVSGSENGDLALPSFQKDRESLRHKVANALRAAMVAGRMRPGEVFSAPALAEQFGISATPVREAMLDLSNEGLVEPVRNRGFRVKELTDRELDDITQVRALIEVPTAGEIARKCDSEMARSVEGLRELAREIQRHATEPNLILYVEADRRFHLRLLALAGNPHLVAVVSSLRARSRLYGLQALAERGELHVSAAEHEELVDLVLARDSAAAANLMARHIAHVRGVWAGSAHRPD